LYEGDKIPSGYKNIAVSFILQSMDKTLSDAEINTFQDAILARLAKENIKLRT
jgi:phenylalanyl-tRNA synthetase beta subunit